MPNKAKHPFDIDLAIERLRAAVRPFPKAAMFELAEDGFASPFEQLVACMISIRTQISNQTGCGISVDRHVYVSQMISLGLSAQSRASGNPFRRLISLIPACIRQSRDYNPAAQFRSCRDKRL